MSVNDATFIKTLKRVQETASKLANMTNLSPTSRSFAAETVFKAKLMENAFESNDAKKSISPQEELSGLIDQLKYLCEMSTSDSEKRNSKSLSSNLNCDNGLLSANNPLSHSFIDIRAGTDSFPKLPPDNSNSELSRIQVPFNNVHIVDNSDTHIYNTISFPTSTNFVGGPQQNLGLKYNHTNGQISSNSVLSDRNNVSNPLSNTCSVLLQSRINEPVGNTGSDKTTDDNIFYKPKNNLRSPRCSLMLLTAPSMMKTFEETTNTNINHFSPVKLNQPISNIQEESSQFGKKQIAASRVISPSKKETSKNSSSPFASQFQIDNKNVLQISTSSKPMSPPSNIVLIHHEQPNSLYSKTPRMPQDHKVISVRNLGTSVCSGSSATPVNTHIKFDSLVEETKPSETINLVNYDNSLVIQKNSDFQLSIAANNHNDEFLKNHTQSNYRNTATQTNTIMETPKRNSYQSSSISSKFAPNVNFPSLSISVDKPSFFSPSQLNSNLLNEKKISPNSFFKSTMKNCDSPKQITTFMNRTTKETTKKIECTGESSVKSLADFFNYDNDNRQQQPSSTVKEDSIEQIHIQFSPTKNAIHRHTINFNKLNNANPDTTLNINFPAVTTTLNNQFRMISPSPNACDDRRERLKYHSNNNNIEIHHNNYCDKSIDSTTLDAQFNSMSHKRPIFDENVSPSSTVIHNFKEALSFPKVDVTTTTHLMNSVKTPFENTIPLAFKSNNVQHGNKTFSSQEINFTRTNFNSERLPHRNFPTRSSLSATANSFNSSPYLGGLPSLAPFSSEFFSTHSTKRLEQSKYSEGNKNSPKSFTSSIEVLNGTSQKFALHNQDFLPASNNNQHNSVLNINILHSASNGLRSPRMNHVHSPSPSPLPCLSPAPNRIIPLSTATHQHSGPTSHARQVKRSVDQQYYSENSQENKSLFDKGLALSVAFPSTENNSTRQNGKSNNSNNNISSDFVSSLPLPKEHPKMLNALLDNPHSSIINVSQKHMNNNSLISVSSLPPSSLVVKELTAESNTILKQTSVITNQQHGLGLAVSTFATEKKDSSSSSQAALKIENGIEKLIINDTPQILENHDVGVIPLTPSCIHEVSSSSVSAASFSSSNLQLNSIRGPVIVEKSSVNSSRRSQIASHRNNVVQLTVRKSQVEVEDAISDEDMCSAPPYNGIHPLSNDQIVLQRSYGDRFSSQSATTSLCSKKQKDEKMALVASRSNTACVPANSVFSSSSSTSANFLVPRIQQHQMVPSKNSEFTTLGTSVEASSALVARSKDLAAIHDKSELIESVSMNSVKPISFSHNSCVEDMVDEVIEKSLLNAIQPILSNRIEVITCESGSTLHNNEYQDIQNSILKNVDSGKDMTDKQPQKIDQRRMKKRK